MNIVVSIIQLSAWQWSHGQIFYHFIKIIETEQWPLGPNNTLNEITECWKIQMAFRP